MDKMYCYNYLKDYILEVGHRIVGFDKTILEDKDTLHEFIDARAQLAMEEFERNSDLSGGCSHELAMQTLLADLTELEPTEEEKDAEVKYQEEWNALHGHNEEQYDEVSPRTYEDYRDELPNLIRKYAPGTHGLDKLIVSYEKSATIVQIHHQHRSKYCTFYEFYPDSAENEIIWQRMIEWLSR